MTVKNNISTILNGIFILTVVLFLLDGITSFEIKNQLVKSYTYFGIMVLTPPTLVWNMWTFKKIYKNIKGFALPAISLIGIMIIGPMKIMSSSGSWKTQTVLYQNEHLTFNKVEFQMQDVGALGYNKRIVEVLYLTPFFIITSEIPNDIETRVEWIKVDKEINELDLKFSQKNY